MTDEQPPNTPTPSEYREFLKGFHGRIFDAEQTAAENLNKRLTLLATGALSLSLGFYEKVAPNPEPISLWFLGASWILIACSLALNLWYHFNAIRTLEEVREDTQNLIAGVESTIETRKRRRPDTAAYTKAKRCWLLSLTLFMLGIASFLVFAVYNAVVAIPSSHASTNTLTAPADTTLALPASSSSFSSRTAGSTAATNAPNTTTETSSKNEVTQ